MSHDLGWIGFATSVLQGTFDVIHAAKQEIGLQHVRIGERKKDWGSPACFIYLPNVAQNIASERKGNEDKALRVTIMVLSKTMNESDDLRVWGILEKIAGELDANISLGGSRDHVYEDMSVAPDDFADGSYQTIGMMEVVFRKALCRDIR